MAKASRVVRCGWSVETWLLRPPTVEEVRPERCVGCGHRHRRDGCALHGHGLRARTMLGPVVLGAAPARTVVSVRRYLCTLCRSVLVVVPREHAAGRHFSRPAMLAALALWALLGLDGGEVRRRISPHPPCGFAEPRVWPSLRRWVRARDRLWPEVRVAARATHRQTAASLVSALCARLSRAPPLPSVAEAWEAAALV